MNDFQRSILKMSRKEKLIALDEAKANLAYITIHLDDIDAVQVTPINRLSGRQVEILNYLIGKANCGCPGVKQKSIADYLECTSAWIDHDMTVLLRRRLIEPIEHVHLGKIYTVNKEMLKACSLDTI
jgi:hypothetical protein